jgi:hypothetical protein
MRTPTGRAHRPRGSLDFNRRQREGLQGVFDRAPTKCLTPPPGPRGSLDFNRRQREGLQGVFDQTPTKCLTPPPDPEARRRALG